MIILGKEKEEWKKERKNSRWKERRKREGKWKGLLAGFSLMHVKVRLYLSPRGAKKNEKEIFGILNQGKDFLPDNVI